MPQIRSCPSALLTDNVCTNRSDMRVNDNVRACGSTLQAVRFTSSICTACCTIQQQRLREFGSTKCEFSKMLLCLRIFYYDLNNVHSTTLQHTENDASVRFSKTVPLHTKDNTGKRQSYAPSTSNTRPTGVLKSVPCSNTGRYHLAWRHPTTDATLCGR